MIFGHIFAKITWTYINKLMVYWTSPCIDHIPKVFVSVPFFQKSYHIKTIVPSETKFLGFFSENNNFHIYAPIMLVCKVVFLVIELSGNTMHGFIC